MESVLKCPVTALKIIGDYLLSGQGCRVVVYSLKTYDVICTDQVFKYGRIHKINICENIHNDQIVFLGGKSVRCAAFVTDNESKTFRLSFTTNEKQFNSWIWDIVWFYENTFLLISAHNTVLVWDIENNHDEIKSSCVQQCILYSATFSMLDDELVVATGTVFNQVLLWKPVSPVKKKYENVWKAFIGHEGVIFRIQVYSEKAQLISVSDDRSIRLWNITDTNCLKVFYGHSARVWDARYIDDNIISVGEDSVCIIWNKDGKVLKKYGGHKGKSIWSLDVCQQKIVTGGGDGAIRLWYLKDEVIMEREPLLKMDIPGDKCKDDFPRVVKLVGHDHVLTFTNNGVLWKYTRLDQIWLVMHEDECFNSYCCLDIFDSYVAIGNIKGSIKIICLETGTILLEQTVFSGKIFNLLWLSTADVKFILLSGPDGCIQLLRFLGTSFVIENTFVLPYSRQQWVSAACLSKGNSKNDLYLVCGDRRGSLHLYHSASQEPLQSIISAHGKAGVTRVLLHDGYIYTTGRDGRYHTYLLNDFKKTLETIDVQRVCKGLDWIEGIRFDRDDMIIYGFYMQSYFAAWSVFSNDMLFKIKCGGGYRSWDVKFPYSTSKMISFGYLKGTSINIMKFDWTSRKNGQIIQEPLHGRETQCLKVLARYRIRNDVMWLLSTCSEDTTISFHLYNPRLSCLKHVHTATGHIGGVKSVDFIQTSIEPLEGYLISCGSRTSLKLWKLKGAALAATALTPVNKGAKESDGDIESDMGVDTYCSFWREYSREFSCSLKYEIYNPELSSKQAELKSLDVIDDMRYLQTSNFFLSDLYPDNENVGRIQCCVCACSDGYARIYILHTDIIELLTTLDFHQHCVLNVMHCIKTFDTSPQLQCIVFTAATDGKVALWDITKLLNHFLGERMIGRVQNKELHNAVNIVMDDVAVDTNHRAGDVQVKTKKYHINSNKFKFHNINIPVYSDIEPCFHVTVHQSGVNAMDVFELSNGFLLVTGGDDNALSLCKIIMQDGRFELGDSFCNLNAHVSSISAVKFVREEFCISTSIDQRIKIWQFSLDRKFHLKREIFTNVADVSNMEVWLEGDMVYIAVTGVGVEIFREEEMKAFGK